EQAVATVAAVLLAEVAQQRVGLATGVLDQVDDVLDARDLLLLAAPEALSQIGDEPGDIRALDETGKALAHARHLQLEQVLLGQVLQGTHQTLPLLAQHRRQLVQCEGIPLTAFLGVSEKILEELRALTAEAGEDRLQWH